MVKKKGISRYSAMTEFILKNRCESMAMKVTPPEANVINAVDVIEHILGRDGLIEQNKDILLKPILFNEITLEDDY